MDLFAFCAENHNYFELILHRKGPDCPFRTKLSPHANFTQLLTEFQKLCKLRLLPFGAN